MNDTIITKKVVKVTEIALKKKYDTPFERLGLEEIEGFEDLGSLKVLKKLYNREGCLKVGEKFITYEVNDSIRKLMIGKVTGVNTYEVESIYYDAEEVCLIFEDNSKVEERTVEASDRRIKQAERFGSTVFSKKDYIPYNDGIREYLESTFVWGPDTWVHICSTFISDETEELAAAKYVIKMNNEIARLFERLQHSEGSNSYIHCDIKLVDDISIGEKLDVVIKIPGTNRSIVMWRLEE